MRDSCDYVQDLLIDIWMELATLEGTTVDDYLKWVPVSVQEIDPGSHQSVPKASQGSMGQPRNTLDRDG